MQLLKRESSKDSRQLVFGHLASSLEGETIPSLAEHLSSCTYGEYEEDDHLQDLIAALEDVADGKITRLMVFMPPRHSKTWTILGFLTWILRYENRAEVIYATYNKDQALDMSGTAQDFFEASGGTYRTKKVSKESWRTSTGGRFRVVGAGTGLTGKGGHILVLDDAVKDAMEAHSLVVQNARWEWYNSTFYTRRTNPPKESRRNEAAIIVVMTLWSQHDIPIKIIEAEKKLADAGIEESLTPWTILSFPAIKTPRTMAFPKHFNVIKDKRKEGEALCPRVATVIDLKKLRDAYIAGGTEWIWQSLYQQEPITPEGVHIKRTWVTPFLNRHQIPRFIRWFRPWDLSFTKDRGDRTVSALCGIDNNRHYWIIPDVSVQCEAPDVRDIIMRQALIDPENTYYGIERKHAGLAIIDDLKREGPLSTRPIYESIPHRDKVARASNWISKARAGEVHVIAEDGISQTLAEEMLASWTTFRGEDGDFDDWVDMVSILDEMASKVYGDEEEDELVLTPFEVMQGKTHVERSRKTHAAPEIDAALPTSSIGKVRPDPSARRFEERKRAITGKRKPPRPEPNPTSPPIKPPRINRLG